MFNLNCIGYRIEAWRFKTVLIRELLTSPDFKLVDPKVSISKSHVVTYEDKKHDLAVSVVRDSKYGRIRICDELFVSYKSNDVRLPIICRCCIKAAVSRRLLMEVRTSVWG